MMNVGSKIRKVRELKGFSQEFVANQLNISQAAYSKIERANFVKLERVEAIAIIFGIDPLQLLKFDDQFIFKDNNKIEDKTIGFIYEEREQYEKRIINLEEEILFLRNQVNNLTSINK